MSRTKVYIKPFDTTGAYSSYIDVSKYVIEKDLKIKNKLDNNEFNVGVFKYANLSLTFNNASGKFSDIDDIRSIFVYKRARSKVKITWDMASEDMICGVAHCDSEVIGEEITVFEGLLNDDGSKTDIRDQNINFTILGFESIFSEVETPYSSLSNGDNISDIIYNCLDQSAITSLLTVSSSNIDLSIDSVVDDISDLENTTVKEALDDLLEMSNSVLTIKNNTIHVSARIPSSEVSHTFHGQASLTGVEDIIKIGEVRKGLNKTFNFWTWEDTILFSSDSTSTDLYGLRKKEIGFSGITNNTSRQNILDDLKTEFKLPKKELKLTAPLTYDLLDLKLLDKVAIDYPTLYFPADENALPLYGVAKFGVAKFPYGEWSLTFETTDNFKILGIETSLKKEEITFNLREV